MEYAIGVDIGGTTIKAGVITSQDQVLVTVRRQTPGRDGPAAVLRTCLDAIDAVRQSVSVDIGGIGVASAGRIDGSGVVAFSTDTFRDWAGTPLRQLLETATGLPVAVENDANAAAFAEAMVGAGAGFASTFFVALGTGVGGGWVDRGRIAHGANGGAGEIGHLLYRAGERPCTCGYAGCFEPYVSVRALAQGYSLRQNRSCDGRAVLTAFAEGEPAAAALVREWVKALAALVYSVQNAYDPHCIVIGGGVIDDADMWWSNLLGELQSLPLSTTVLPAQLKSQAAMVGAARLLWRTSETKQGGSHEHTKIE